MEGEGPPITSTCPGPPQPYTCAPVPALHVALPGPLRAPPVSPALLFFPHTCPLSHPFLPHVLPPPPTRLLTFPQTSPKSPTPPKIPPRCPSPKRTLPGACGSMCAAQGVGRAEPSRAVLCRDAPPRARPHTPQKPSNLQRRHPAAAEGRDCPLRSPPVPSGGRGAHGAPQKGRGQRAAVRGEMPHL